MSRAREAGQQLAASYYGFDGFPEFMLVIIINGNYIITIISIMSIVSGGKNTANSFSKNVVQRGQLC